MTTNLDNPSPTRSVELPSNALEEIARAASKMGLQPGAYLLLLHAIKSGEIEPSITEAVREVFSHDREILKELAR